jgi:hypothetical protein
MVVIETTDSVFALPDGIAKVCVRERGDATSKLVDVNLLDSDVTGVFLVLISQRVPTTANKAGFLPLWSFVVGTSKRESADKIFTAISQAVFVPDTEGNVQWLDIRAVLADDVREVPASRQGSVGKGRAIDIDGTGVAAATAPTKAAEVTSTRLRAPVSVSMPARNTGGYNGWLGNNAIHAWPPQQVEAAAAIARESENWSMNNAIAAAVSAVSSGIVDADVVTLQDSLQGSPNANSDVQQLGRAGATPVTSPFDGWVRDRT